jgi:type IV secretion system protein VirD4
LGRSGRTLLAAEERRSVIVIAPTQSLKTTGFAVPALLEWQGPVLATSVKNDLLADTFNRRAAMGEVMVFDPAQVTDRPRSQATPLWGAGTWRGAMRVAHWLMAGARDGGAAGLQDADFWLGAAEKLLAPLLFAAAANGFPIEQVVHWLDEGPDASAGEIGKLLEETEAPQAKRAWQATLNREERQLSSVFTTAEMAMAAFADPRVIAETAAAEYSPTALLDGGMNSLYLCAPRSEQERLRPVFSMIVQELLAVVEESVALTGKPLNPPLLLLLDEAANVAPFPGLDEVASTGAGQGVQLLTIFQDLAQINVRYGRRAQTILNNHTAKVIGSGISDPETLSWASRIVGAGEFEQRSQTAGEKGRRSKTEGETFRDLVHPITLRGASPGNGILIYGNLPPAGIRFRPWFRDRELGELRNTVPGGTGSEGVEDERG